jgi:hypothetical protein
MTLRYDLWECGVLPLHWESCNMTIYWRLLRVSPMKISTPRSGHHYRHVQSHCNNWLSRAWTMWKMGCVRNKKWNSLLEREISCTWGDISHGYTKCQIHWSRDAIPDKMHYLKCWSLTWLTTQPFCPTTDKMLLTSGLSYIIVISFCIWADALHVRPMHYTNLMPQFLSPGRRNMNDMITLVYVLYMP